jgi:hypothetical protein
MQCRLPVPRVVDVGAVIDQLLHQFPIAHVCRQVQRLVGLHVDVDLCLVVDQQLGDVAPPPLRFLRSLHQFSLFRGAQVGHGKGGKCLPG